MSIDESRAMPDGIDVLEIDELPADQRLLARILLRRGELAAPMLQQLAQESSPELDPTGFAASLATLRERQIVRQSDSIPPLLRLNLRRKAGVPSGSRAASSLWDALD